MKNQRISSQNQASMAASFQTMAEAMMLLAKQFIREWEHLRDTETLIKNLGFKFTRKCLRGKPTNKSLKHETYISIYDFFAFSKARLAFSKAASRFLSFASSCAADSSIRTFLTLLKYWARWGLVDLGIEESFMNTCRIWERFINFALTLLSMTAISKIMRRFLLSAGRCTLILGEPPVNLMMGKIKIMKFKIFIIFNTPFTRCYILNG